MTHFEMLLSSGLSVTWGAILVGWRGPSLHPGVVSSSEVISYATDQIVRGVADTHARYVVEIASVDASDIRSIECALSRLASLDGFDLHRETLKWEVVLLRELLQSLSSDPADALMELTHFWSLFDYPADSPHVIQGMGNSISPQDYYTDKSLASILDVHYRWLEARESDLKA